MQALVSRPTLTLGLVSLVIWTLIIITAVKYASFVMRVDNDGEGGILAMMSLLGGGQPDSHEY